MKEHVRQQHDKNGTRCYIFLPPQYVKGVDGQDDDTLDRVEKVTILVWKETRSDLGWRELDAEEEPPLKEVEVWKRNEVKHYLCAQSRILTTSLFTCVLYVERLCPFQRNQ